MKPKLIISFLMIIIIPLAILSWFGLRIADDEQRLVNERLNNILTGRLLDINSNIDKFVKSEERKLLKLLNSIKEESPSLFHKMKRNHPIVRQVFVRKKNGKLSYPHMSSYQEWTKSKFYERTKSIWDSQVRFFNHSLDSKIVTKEYGWYTWFWGKGIHFIFWQKHSSGRVIGIELNRIAFMADLIGKLPETDQQKKNVPLSRIVLTDVQNEILYQWGRYKPQQNQKPSAKIALNEPLGSWNLQFYIPPNSLIDSFGDSAIFNLMSGIFTVMVAVILLALYFYRENSLEIKEASEKVSFVNKVSHELKTPLTNIRMYAEFLENSVSKRDKKSREYAGIVISESQRLSRLISNVLTFAKKQNNNLVLHKNKCCVDDAINSVLDSFSIALNAKGIKIYKNLDADIEGLYNEDALKQILSNLINNVEKYAASGKYLGIKSIQYNNLLTITVEDRGDGISEKKLKEVFKPFIRLSDKLSDGVSGTGIGLTIARDLARLHGGDLTVISDLKKTIFTVTIQGGI
jgi:signal transduction histidine kinase